MATKTQNSRSASTSNEAAPQVAVADATQAASPDVRLGLEAPPTDAENASAADEVLKHVPDLGGGSVEAEHESWRHGTASVIREARRSKVGYDQACLIGLFMAVLDYVHAPDKTYKNELDEQGLTPPNSNHPFAPASAAIFGRNIKGNTQASKDITKDCRAFDGLVILTDDRPGGLRSFSRSRESIRDLLEITKDKGGIAGLGAIEGAPEGGEAPKLLRLNRESVQEIIAERVRTRLKAKGVSLAVLAKHVTEDGAVEYGPLPEEERLPFEPESLVLPHMRAADDRVQFLAELFDASKAIRERKTNRPVDPRRDPNDASTPMRVTSRQFVLLEDGTINVSPILTSSAPVIRVRQFAEGGLLRQPMHGDVVLQTFGRRRAEANIQVRETRGVWDLKLVEPAPAKDGLGRIQITTRAEAGKGPGDKLTDVGILLQQVKSSTDENPLEVVETEFQAQCLINKDVFSEHTAFSADPGRVLKRKDQQLTLEIREKTLFVNVARTGRKVPAENSRNEAKITISAEDYTDFLLAMSKLSVDISAPVICEISREDLVLFKFATQLASYEIFLPALKEGRRSNRSIRVMQPRTWPSDKPMKFEA